MKNIFNYLKVLISIALLVALAWIMRDKLSGIGVIIKGADKMFVLAALGLLMFGMILQAFRLKILLDAQSIHLSIKDLIFLTFIGQFFNNFMPTSIGGDVVKAYYASGRSKKKLETFTAVAVDRMLGVITLVWISVFAFIFGRQQAVNKMVIFIVCFMAMAGTLFMAVIFNKKAAKIFLWFKNIVRSHRRKDHLQRLYDATNQYRRHKLYIFHALWLSLVAQLFFFYMAYILAISISSRVSFLFLLKALPAISTISMLPSVNGLGIRESGFVGFLGNVMGRDNAFALSLLYLGVTLIASMLGGIIFLFKREFKHIIKSEVSIK